MSMVKAMIDIEKTLNWLKPSPIINVDINQNEKNKHSYFNNRDKGFLLMNR
jgi:hypothetical protein